MAGPSTRVLERRALVVLSVLVLAAPVLASTASAIAGDWLPAGDVATMAMRTADVLSSDVPLVGPTSSADLSHGLGVAWHPGPLVYWFAAPLYALAGHNPVGLLLAVAVVNLAAVAGIAVAAWRIGGERLLLTVAVATGAMQLSLGNGVLHDPWNPHVILLPTLAALLLLAGAAAGDLRLLPGAILAASYASQGHTTALGLIGLCALAVAGALVQRHRSGASVPGDRRWILASIVLGLVLWAGPLVDQVAGEGNLAATLGASTGGTRRLGVAGAAVMLVDALGVVPQFADPTGSTVVDVRLATSADLVAWGSVLAGAALLAGMLRSAVARRQRTRATILASVVIASAATLVTLALLPGASLHKLYLFRLLWPITAYAWALLAWCCWEWVLERRGADERSTVERWSARAASLGAVGLLVATPLAVGTFSPRDDAARMRAVRAAATQVAASLDPDAGPYLLRPVGGAFWDAAPALALELERRGYTIVQDVGAQSLVVGPDRAWHGEALAGQVLVTISPGAREESDGGQLLAFVPMTQEPIETPMGQVRAIGQTEPLRWSPAARAFFAESVRDLRAGRTADESQFVRQARDLLGEVLLGQLSSASLSELPAEDVVPAVVTQVAQLSDPAVLFLLQQDWLTGPRLPGWLRTRIDDRDDSLGPGAASGLAAFLLPPPAPSG